MSKTITIPTDRGRPFVVILNGIKHIYAPGETVEVPDGVALEIDECENWDNKYLPEDTGAGSSTGGGAEVKTCNVTIRGISENIWFGEVRVLEYVYTKYKDGKFEVVQEQRDEGIFGAGEFEVTFENVVCGTVLYFRAISGGNNDITITFDECLTIIDGYFDEELGAYAGNCRGFIISPDANDCTVTINTI